MFQKPSRPAAFTASAQATDQHPTHRLKCRRAINQPLGQMARMLLPPTLAVSFFMAAFAPAHAQDKVLSRGDAVVSGFAGIAPSDKPLPLNANPLDHFFIDLEGPSAQIMSLNHFGSAPVGQRITPTVKRLIKAKEVGQVFAITLDDGLGADTPNIYFGATSAYGIQIVGEDKDGNGAPDRLKKGADGAQFMVGQFGPAPEGNPGTIWRLDGETGEITPFATLPGNTGAGVGDIVFDKQSKHFYASDLDQGMIHRMDKDGVLIDSFDHGTDGRPAKGLDAVADDGTVMNIANPAFDSEDSKTWGYTQKERMVYGMAVHNGRLYYAVTADHQIWSVGLSDDGSFAGDPRWELDVENLPGEGPITDMLFDTSGRMYLAQRGTEKGSYKFAEFTAPAKSEVVRYTRETPDDPATPSVWSSDPEGYPIGLPKPHFNTNGGIALGYGHDASGSLKTSKRGQMLWTTGERLRPSTNEGTENDVHGLQGNDISLTGPENAPPKSVYFADYDGYFNDPEKAGHMGDIEIWQPVKGKVTTYEPPVYLPPIDTPWEEIPPVTPGYKTNLELTKTASFKECFDTGFSWRCEYEVRVRNTSATNWFDGEIRVRDELLDAVDLLGFNIPQDGFTWTCSGFAPPNTFGCKRNAVLAPGASVAFDVEAYIQKSTKKCFLTNTAKITHPIGGSWQNTKIVDDADSATIAIPNPDCEPTEDHTNIEIEKTATPDSCFLGGGDIYCEFKIIIRNNGLGKFEHTLSIQDDSTPGTTVQLSPLFNWNCVPNGGGQLCTHTTDPLTLMPTQEEVLWSYVKVPLAVAQGNACQIRNDVRIATPGAPHPMNTNFGDDVSGDTATIPAEICRRPETNLLVEKHADNDKCEKMLPLWGLATPSYRCDWTIVVTNTSANTYKDEIYLDEQLNGASSYADWSAPWNCFGGNQTFACAHPYVELAAGASVTLNLTTSFSEDVVKANNCNLTNDVAISWAPGGSPLNTNPGDDTANAGQTVDGIGLCFLPKKLNNQCPSGFKMTDKGCKRKGPDVITLPKPGPKCRNGWTQYAKRSSIPSGYRKIRRRLNGKSIWCAKKQNIVLPDPQCRRGWKQYPTRSSIPSGYRKETRRLNGKTIWCGKRRKDTAGPTCPRTHKTYDSRYDVPKGWTWFKRSRNGKTVWCAKQRPIVLPDPKCRRGWKQYRTRSSIPSGYRKETRRLNGKTIWCGKPGSGRGPKCSGGWNTHTSRPHLSTKKYFVQKKTRNGKTVWCSKKKTIKLIPCGPGYIGFKPACIKIKKCKRWETGNWPNCQRKPCPRGYTGVQPNCKKRPGSGHGEIGTYDQKPKKKLNKPFNNFKLKLKKKNTIKIY